MPSFQDESAHPGTALLNVAYRFKIFLIECVAFLGNVKLWQLRWLLFSHYFFFPWWLKQQQKQLHDLIPKGDLTYGETPFITSQAILHWGKLKPGDTIWDLGCGRGTMVIFSALHNIHAVGIDILPLFINLGKLISQKLKLSNTTWICGNFLEINFLSLPEPAMVYLPSTAFSWPTIQELTKKLSQLHSGVKVVSLSCPLPSNEFVNLGKKEFSFSWGKATAYLQQRR